MDREVWYGVGFFIAIITYWAMLNNDALNEIMLDDTSCEGIGIFYSGKGLLTDASHITNITTYNTTVLPRTPEDYYRYGGSCTSRAKTVMCLCEAYNATCNYYYNIAPAKHVGVIYYPDQKLKVNSDLLTLS